MNKKVSIIMLIKNLFFSIKIMFEYARWPTVMKLLQTIVVSTMTPLSTVFISRLIDSLINYFNGEAEILCVIAWGIALVLSMFILTSSTFIDSILSISIKKTLNTNFTEHVIDKFNKIEYSNFENDNTLNIISRVGNSPQDIIISVFNDAISLMSSAVNLIGVMLVLFQVSWFFAVLYFVIVITMVFLDYKAIKIMNEMHISQTLDERFMSYYSMLLSKKISLLELKVF